MIYSRTECADCWLFPFASHPTEIRNLFAHLLHQEAHIATSECYSTSLRGKNAATTEMLFVCLFV